jgi:molybdopterin converting factor small subunit
MDKEKIIIFVLAIYRITDKFPKEEPLKNVIRKNALEMIEEYFLFLNKPTLNNSGNNLIFAKLETLDHLFILAEKQNWLNPKNFAILRKEIQKMKEEFKNRNQNKVKSKIKDNLEKRALKLNSNREQRCQKILEVLGKEGKIKVSDIQKYFPQITKRTLRRDLRYLFQTRQILRIGDRINTYYILNNKGENLGQNNSSDVLLLS